MWTFKEFALTVGFLGVSVVAVLSGNARVELKDALDLCEATQEVPEEARAIEVDPYRMGTSGMVWQTAYFRLDPVDPGHRLYVAKNHDGTVVLWTSPCVPEP